MPGPPGPVVAEAARRAAGAAEQGARRLGIDRRAFLVSSAGTAVALSALAACSKESGSSSGPGGTAGTFTVPTEATTDTTAAGEALGPSEAEVVVDVQTHFIDGDGAGFGSGFPQAGCGSGDCFSIETWADLVLGQSDTSVAVLSAIPIVGDDGPMSIERMERARELGESLCGDRRVLLQGEAFPQVGDLGAFLERMVALREEHDLVAWKTYTHTGAGYSFADERGEAFLAQVEAIGPRVVCVHKGFGADPADLGPAAAAHPDITFCVYHSGFEPGGAPEGAFAEDGGGVDRFVRTLRDAGVGPGANVYAELGSTWRAVLADPDQAAHALGKLLVAVGPERILWGTDSIWYGSPQDQIEAFRSFEITAEAQERFGYPELTRETKRRILGANAAELHGLDLSAVEQPCREAQEEARGRFGNRTVGPVTRRQVLEVWHREHPWFPFPSRAR